jgi:hypothetical protein
MPGIQFDSAGLSLTISGSARATSKLAWGDVTKATAYRRSLLTIDLICIVFTTPDGILDVHEEMTGWSDLVEALPKLLPGTPPFPVWSSKVAQGPSSTNATVIFARS